MSLFKIILTKEQIEKEKIDRYKKCSNVLEVWEKYEPLINQAKMQEEHKYMEVKGKRALSCFTDEDILGAIDILHCECYDIEMFLERVRDILEHDNSISIDMDYVVAAYDLINDILTLADKIMFGKDLVKGFYISNVEFIQLKFLIELQWEYDSIITGIYNEVYALGEKSNRIEMEDEDIGLSELYSYGIPSLLSNALPGIADDFWKKIENDT